MRGDSARAPRYTEDVHTTAIGHAILLALADLLALGELVGARGAARVTAY